MNDMRLNVQVIGKQSYVFVMAHKCWMATGITLSNGELLANHLGYHVPCVDSDSGLDKGRTVAGNQNRITGPKPGDKVFTTFAGKSGKHKIIRHGVRWANYGHRKIFGIEFGSKKFFTNPLVFS